MENKSGDKNGGEIRSARNMKRIEVGKRGEERRVEG